MESACITSFTVRRPDCRCCWCTASRRTTSSTGWAHGGRRPWWALTIVSSAWTAEAMAGATNLTIRLRTLSTCWQPTCAGCWTSSTSFLFATSATRWGLGSGCSRCSTFLIACTGLCWAASGRAVVPGNALRGGKAETSTALTFQRFAAARPTNDLEALAACMEGLGRTARVDKHRLAAIWTPILLVAGDRDDIARDVPTLAAEIPTARLVTIPGRDHLSTVPARPFKEAALEFLAQN